MVAAVSAYGARAAHLDAKETATREANATLARTAWYGTGAVERVLQEHVAFVERTADGKTPEVQAVRDALTQAGDRARPVAADPGAAAKAIGGDAERKPFDDWLVQCRDRLKDRWSDDSPRAVALNLVVADGDRSPAHAFSLGLVSTDRELPATPAEFRAQNPAVYARDWAFRDYFNGGGNRFGREGEPFPVVRHTHISHAYRSSMRGRPWLVDISTPVWTGPDRTGRVVGLLSIGIRVDYLQSLINMPLDFLKEGDRTKTAESVSGFLVNDRECWVWHKEGMARLADDLDDTPPKPRDPDNLRALAYALSARPPHTPADDYVPWFRVADGPTAYSDEYIDPVRVGSGTAAGGGWEIAHTLTFHPYANSRYMNDPDPTGGPLKDRTWAFVVQVDREVALQPVSGLWGDMVRAGSALVATLIGLAVVLWVWLFRLLRGWEFAAHG